MTEVYNVISGVQPGDDLEAAHRTRVLRWLRSTDDVFRRMRPASPPQHLVSYVVPLDVTDGSMLLVDHVNANLWLPPGGHVDPDEHPAAAAHRELREELGLTIDVGATAMQPVFLTANRVVGGDGGHTDVGLWYLVAAERSQPVTPMVSEFREARWWTRKEIETTDPELFDPHFGRFIAKISQQPGPALVHMVPRALAPQPRDTSTGSGIL